MKRLAAAALTATSAGPALAHSDGAFHTHGVEITLVLLLAAAGLALLHFNRD